MFTKEGVKKNRSPLVQQKPVKPGQRIGVDFACKSEKRFPICSQILRLITKSRVQSSIEEPNGS